MKKPYKTFAAIVIAASLTSCEPFRSFITIPSEHREERDCVFHKYDSKLPQCKKYNFLPPDRSNKVNPNQKMVMVKDYDQYKGKLKKRN